MPTETTEAELLADLLEGKVAPADVPPELAELASLADAVSEHITLVPPTDAFRESLRDQVVQSAGGGGGAGGSGGAGGAGSGATTAATTAASGGLSAVVAGLAATAVLATSTVAAADRAGPGDLLAGLDRGLESLQLAIADDARDAELLVDFAAERILEAVELADTAVVTDLLGQAEDLLDEAVALGVAQGRDLEQLVSPFTAALRTLASRTDVPVVEAQVVQLLEDVGADPSSVPDLVPGGADDGDAPAVGGTEDDGAGTDGTEDAEDTGDQPAEDDGLLDDPTAPLDDPTAPVDELDDPLEDPLDDPTEPIDDLDDPVEDTTDELEDTTDIVDG